MALSLLACTRPLERAPSPRPAPRQATTAAGFAADIAPLLDRYCVSCHGDEKKKGGLDIAALLDQGATPASFEDWQAMLDRVDQHDMPPEDERQPSPEERTRLVRWIDENALRLDCRDPDPGRVTARRLNRTEYENTIHDLLGTDIPLADAFPVDNSGHGFDNMADALTMSPLLLERHLHAADQALNAVIHEPGLVKRTRRRVRADLTEIAHQARPRGDGWVVLSSWSDEDAVITVELPFASEFAVTVRAQATRRPGKKKSGAPYPLEPVTFSFVVDGQAQQTVTVGPRAPRDYTAVVKVPAGRHRVGVAHMKDKTGLSPAEAALPGTGKNQDTEVTIGHLELDGPLQIPTQPGPAHRRLLGDDSNPRDRHAAARPLLQDFARRAFRRPVTASELDRLVALAARTWQAGGSFVAGMRQALRAVLVSPQFLFRTEGVREVVATDVAVPLDDHTLAARLSYFLWSRMPDEALLADAARGTLRENLLAHVERMLADPRARALVDNFGGQWLQFRKVRDATPAWFVFKTWNEALRIAAEEETRAFLRNLLAEDRSVLDILTADYTFVNEALAKHYGLPDVQGDGFRRVSLAGTPRRGVLTHASVLTLTSTPMRTSPVKRGLWVLEALLDAPPPPPPPDIPMLQEGREVKGTLRERLEAHRENPMCASCHARMDPLGFALETFDAVGGYRTTDNGGPIDARGSLNTGERFEGARELSSVLAGSRRDDFVRAFTRKLLTYALGRGLEPSDRCAVQEIMAQARRADHRVSSFVKAIVTSRPFLHTRGRGGDSPVTASHDPG